MPEMWLLFYLAVRSPVNMIANFNDRPQCEAFLKDLRSVIKIESGGCIHYQPKVAPNGDKH